MERWLFDLFPLLPTSAQQKKTLNQRFKKKYRAGGEERGQHENKTREQNTENQNPQKENNQQEVTEDEGRVPG